MTTLKKFWIVFCIKNNGAFIRYESYEAAEIVAKRLAFDDRNNEFIILEAVAVAQPPIPSIDVVRL